MPKIKNHQNKKCRGLRFLLRVFQSLKTTKIRNVGGYVSHFRWFPVPENHQNKKCRGLRFFFKGFSKPSEPTK